MKPSKLYRVREVFASIQGEGANAGTSAVFVRFAGCNAWNGRPSQRVESAAESGAVCPTWCDTDFLRGDSLDLDGVVDRVEQALESAGVRPELLVFTGGEPLLQLDALLVGVLKGRFRVAVETNGSFPVPSGVSWVTVSPKWLGPRWVQREGDELKVVVPALDPAAVLALEGGAGFRHYFLQPQDGAPGALGVALEAVRRDPRWRLSLQLHKLLGLP